MKIGSKMDSISSEFEEQKVSAKNLETNFDQKMGQSASELKCIKTDLSAFNQVNKDFLHVVKVKKNQLILYSIVIERFKGESNTRHTIILSPSFNIFGGIIQNNFFYSSLFSMTFISPKMKKVSLKKFIWPRY